MSDRINIEFSGPGHSGKTNLRVLIARHLETLGVKVVLQKADPQLEEKLEMDDDTLKARLNGIEVVLTEIRTHGGAK